MTVPPTPGNAFWTASMDFKSESMPADSSNPCTTSASFSCSVSKILTSFSLGSGFGTGLFDSGTHPPRNWLLTDYGSHYTVVLWSQRCTAKGSLIRERKVPQWRLEPAIGAT